MQATGTAVDPAAPAASAPFPARWADDFEASTVESLPKYWADQCGSFQIMPSSGGRTGNSILQRVPMHPGHNKWHENLKNPLRMEPRGRLNPALKSARPLRRSRIHRCRRQGLPRGGTQRRYHHRAALGCVVVSRQLVITRTWVAYIAGCAYR